MSQKKLPSSWFLTNQSLRLAILAFKLDLLEVLRVRQQTTKMLIRLYRCTGWAEPLLFIKAKTKHIGILQSKMPKKSIYGRHDLG